MNRTTAATPASTQRPPEPDSAWAAIERRDRSADGTFVYGVRTTGVYCRPSCPSRRPRRPNVILFSTPADATGAGFRPCRRCRPEASPGPDPIDRAYRMLVNRSAAPKTLAEIARAVGLSRYHLQRRFKARFGLTPGELTAGTRSRQLRQLLRREGTVSRATYDAGYGSSSRVYEQSNRRLGMTPAVYAKGGQGMTIRYTTLDSPLGGRLLVAVTDRGVCAVSLGRSDAALTRELEEEFPAASLVRVDRGADAWLAGLVRQVADRLLEPAAARSTSALPLDLVGTAFEQGVWRALLAIPPGETRSYGAVARALGRPGASRAVGRAVAANRVAVVVPCHRVIRQDGSLGGYRWGVPIKRALLAREGASQGG